MLSVLPCTVQDALPFADAHHSHLDRPESGLFAVAVCLLVREVISMHVVAESWGRTVCVAIASRPGAIPLQNLGYCCEVSRVASDGTAEHAASMALGAIRRAALALGYLRLVSYTILGEAGTSYRAAGWWPTARVKDRQRSCPSRPRAKRVLIGDRIRWETGPRALTPPPRDAESLRELLLENIGRPIRERTVSDLPLFGGVT